MGMMIMIINMVILIIIIITLVDLFMSERDKHSKL